MTGKSNPGDIPVTTLTRVDGQPDKSAGSGVTWERDIARGTQIGRYLILNTLGKGGMGVVYLAYDPGLERKVALKIVIPKHHEVGGGQLRILREAQAIARLSHPHVVAVYDVASFADGVFMAMEYVDGPDLAKWLKGNRLLEEIIGVLVAAGQGIAAAHDAGLVHRDIKPSNVLVASDGRVRVLDFGLARSKDTTESRPISTDKTTSAEESRSSHITHDGVLLGTPAYMAPELHEGAPPSVRSDVFAFSVTMFEAIYGVRPFVRAKGERWKEAIARGPVWPPVDPKAVPARLKHILSQGLQLDPGLRTPSVAVMVEHLRGLGETRRRRWSVTGVALMLALGVGIGLLPMWRQSSGPCEGVGDELRSLWTPRRSAAIEDAFIETEVPFASAAHRRTADAIDDYVGAWGSAREQSCAATLIEHRRSGSQMDLELACLEHRRTHLVAVLEALEHADAKVVENASITVITLPSIDACLDPQRARELPPIPSDATARAEVAAVRIQLANLSTQRVSGRLSRALSLLGQLERKVTRVGFSPVVAEFHLEAARVRADHGDRAEAESHLRAAIRECSRHPYESLRAAALIELGVELGVEQKRLGAGEEALRTASSALDGQDASPHARAQLQFARARMAQAHDDMPRAQELFLDLLSRDDHDIPRHEINHRLSANLLDFSATRRYAEAALEEREMLFGDAHPKVADTLLQLSRAHALLSDRNAAIEAAERARQIRIAVFGEQSLAVADAIAAKGYAEARAHDDEKAAVYFEHALALTRADPDAVEFDVAVKMGNLGVMYSRLGRHPAARELHRQSLKMLQRVDPEHPRRTVPLLNTAATYAREGEFDAAIEWYERAIDAMIDSPSSRSRVADFEVEVADLQRELGDPEAAAISMSRAQRRYLSERPEEPAQWVLVQARLTREGGDHARAAALARRGIDRLENLAEAARPRGKLGEMRFELARALWDGGDEADALAQAHTAAEEVERDASPDRRVDPRAWLDSHR